MLALRDAYERVGGHSAVRASLHDGITLPRAFRAAGFPTDIFDATDTAVCRMYHGSRACWRGLAKNATEGMGSPRAIGLWTALLLGGHVLPAALLVIAWTVERAGLVAASLAAAATLGMLAVRVAAAIRFRQRVTGALLHPVAVLVLVALQWDALLRRLAGQPAAWKGRAYANAGAE